METGSTKAAIIRAVMPVRWRVCNCQRSFFFFFVFFLTVMTAVTGKSLRGIIGIEELH